MVCLRVIPFLLVAAFGLHAMVPMAGGSSSPWGGATPTSGGTSTAISPLGFGSPTPLLVPRMRQSVSMSYATNGERSVSQSMYVNEMSWRLSDPLTLHLDVGILAPLWSSGSGSAAYREQTPMLLPRLGLEWRPSDRTLMMLTVGMGDLWNDPASTIAPGRTAP